MEGRLSVGAEARTPAEVTARRGTCLVSPTPAPAPHTTFVVATEWRDDGVAVVSVTGELDLFTASALEDALLALSDEATGRVIVDLARCDFMDLRGLRVLLAARERLERSDLPLALVCGDPNLLRVFKITHVDAFFAIYPSLTAAAEGHAHG